MLKARGQDVEQEAVDELVGGERDRPVPVAVAIISPAEMDGAAFDGDQPGIPLPN